MQAKKIGDETPISRRFALGSPAMHARVLGGRKQMARTKRVGGATVRWTGRPLISKKRTARSRKAMSCIERKLEVLQELVPNCPSVQELDGLFREAANYIVCLQVQVKVMQILLDELSPKVSDN